ncbi:hypothetical protein CAAN1_05S04456 [[Candida] anglica]|uniref:Altered inheritance of mitochondria protein 9, mitochondrial n=1 Tax=[Candida] anglica TaxID=148631 RepID=A0ABP0EHE7_9ASCO
MLRSVGRQASRLRGCRIAQTGAIARVSAQRFQSSKLNTTPTEIYTKISDSTDPQRNAFFQYTWGSWMKNDAVERKRRETRFSIEGVSTVLEDLAKLAGESKNLDKNGTPVLKAPTELNDGTTVLTNNLVSDLIGDVSNNQSLLIKSIASIHEGKHNRIYKITLSTGKDLVLRIPYPLEQQYTTSLVVKSEVATLDFLNLKLGLNVPKVVAYGYDRDNALKSPFILMEYVEGDLLMKQWDPLVQEGSEAGEAQSKLKSVLDPVADFQEKLLSITFNQFGSLYFAKDIEQAPSSPYEGETNPLLQNRWKIGPTTERIYHKGKYQLTKKHLTPHLGPWDKSKPLELISSVAGVQLESLRHRLSLSEAGSSNVIENVELLKSQIATYEHLQTISQKLLNPVSKSISNVEELFKPRLFAPDLDPLNVIISSKTGKPVFVDFENTSIKPFILSSHPPFVAYQGAKVYDLEEDIPGFAEMDEVEKQQYQFMHYKTRNERLWEVGLNERRHDLIAVASPHIKVLKSAYLQALDSKSDKDYLYVEGAIVQLQAMWDAYVANGLVNTEESEFPIKYTAEYLDQHQQELEDFQLEAVSTPFAATGGWVPQDMFVTLKEQGIIVEDENGNFKIETEKALEQDEEEKKQFEEAEKQEEEAKKQN